MNKMRYLLWMALPILVFACKKSDDKTNQAAIDKAILLQYIATDSTITYDSTSTGLYYSIADTGTGTITPHLNSYITVHYKGTYKDGVVFEQTSGSPIKGFLKQFIAGWQEGVPFIRKGGKIKLLIPSALAYGTTGSGSIPANTVLIFEIELVNVE